MPNYYLRTSQEYQECKQCPEERSLNKYNIDSGLANHDKNGMVDAANTYTHVYLDLHSLSELILNSVGISWLSTSVLREYSENLWKNIYVPCTQMELTDGNRGLLI
uniref:Uncharacterized protein n=1 Tax=Trichobilharzia regenti TaxID=157069 RepID=A0AA85K5I1_TRIRE|nr:unnamed protein product [Trichobilharzia regenti]